jgi:hypothetical protein
MRLPVKIMSSACATSIARQPLQAANTSDHAEPCLRQREYRMLGRDADVAGQCDFRPAAQAEPVRSRQRACAPRRRR